MRALRRLHVLGPSKLARWKRETLRSAGVRLPAKIVRQLWHARLVSFGWFDDLYSVTATGVAALAQADAPTPLERLATNELAA